MNIKYMLMKINNKYKKSDEDVDIFNKYKKSKLDELKFKADDLISTIYFSTNIEYEDELTIEDTRLIVNSLVNKRTINRNKDRSEILVKNMFKMYEYINNIYKNKYITSDDLKYMNRLILKDIKDETIIGNYRIFDATIGGREDIVFFTEPENIEKEMNILLEDINNFINTESNKTNYEILTEALVLKTRFINIHPFPDGNGRVSRALFQLLCAFKGLPIPLYVGWKRKDYHNAMLKAYLYKGNVEVLATMYLNEVKPNLNEKEEINIGWN